MRSLLLSFTLGVAVALAGSAGSADAQTASVQADSPVTSHPNIGRGAVTLRAPRFLQGTGSTTQPPTPAARSAVANAATTLPLKISTRNVAGTRGNPPLWTFSAIGSRDPNAHIGEIIGTSPFERAQTTNVATYVIPLIIRTHTIATGFDPQTDKLTTTTPGDLTIDPTAPDTSCLTAPNNVPVNLVTQSPMFTPTHFVFGGADLGKTQFVDAFQRASFFQALGSQVSQYHVLLEPVTTLPAVLIDVPADQGLAITDPTLVTTTHAGGSTSCVPLQFINQTWFDAYVQGTVLPALASEGVNAGNLPLFIVYNTFMGGSDDFDLSGNNCCITGYHNVTGFPVQAYAEADFDRTGFFRGPTTGIDTEDLSHELAEWANDPYLNNEVAPFGPSTACSALLEDADELVGTFLPPITGYNGFMYHLQETAFFSYFLGSPSIGANGWFSDNGTFLTDIGPVCD
jgi:hypothetical protein